MKSAWHITDEVWGEIPKEFWEMISPKEILGIANNDSKLSEAQKKLLFGFLDIPIPEGDCRIYFWRKDVEAMRPPLH